MMLKRLLKYAATAGAMLCFGTLFAAAPVNKARDNARNSVPEIPAYLRNKTQTTTSAPVCPWALDPCVVSVGRELPRRELIPYASAADALAQRYEDSNYLQALDDKWTSTPFREGEITGETFTSTFKLPFAWIDRQLFFRIGSATSSYEVKVNGKPVGYCQNGRAAAEYDLTSAAVEGNNTLEVTVFANGAARRIENYAPADERPAITGRTFVIAQPRVRVRDFVADTRMEGTNGLFSLGVVMKSHLLNFKEYEIYYELISPEGKIVTEGHREARFDMKLEDTVRFFANIPDIRPWNDETPYLYTLQVRTKYEGRFGEYYAIPIGFRTITLENGEVLLNSLPVTFRAVEYAVPENAETIRTELSSLKKRGVNTIVVRDYPAQDELYRACNELGIYVCGQANVNTARESGSIRRGGNPTNDPAWRDAYVDRALTMYHTSKNNPSAALFSIAGEAVNGFNLYESYLALKREEKQRPVIYLHADGQWNSDAESVENDHGRFIFATSNPGDVSVSSRVGLSKPDERGTSFVISNLYNHTPLHAEISYTVRAAGKKAGNGRVIIDLEPGQSKTFTVPAPSKVAPGTPLEITLDVAHEEPVVFRYVGTAGEPAAKQGGVKALIGRSNGSGSSAPTQRVTLAQGTFKATL